MLVLSIHVDGDTCRFAQVEVSDEGRPFWQLTQGNFVAYSRHIRSLAETIEAYLSPCAKQLPVRVVISVQGVVFNNACLEHRRLHWPVDGDALAQSLKMPVLVLNDCVAFGEGLQPRAAIGKELVPFYGSQQHTQRDGNRLAITAGGGLGEAALLPVPNGYRVVPTSGGKRDFAPRGHLQDKLLRYLREADLPFADGRVCCDDILTTEGLTRIYSFLLEVISTMENPAVSDELAGKEPTAEFIISHVMASDTCRAAVQMWLEIFGQEVGNAALTFLPTGGIVLGGELSARLGNEWLCDRSGYFLHGFTRKGDDTGRMTKFTIAVDPDPVQTIHFGAAYAASRM